MIFLFSISRPQRMIELSKVTQMASRTLPATIEEIEPECVPGVCQLPLTSTRFLRLFSGLQCA